MAWVDIDLYKVNELTNAAALDTLRENIEYLHSPNMASYQHPGTGGNYTNTGTLGDDIDGTNFALSLTTSGGLVLACFYCVVSMSAGSSRLGIIHNDPVSHKGRNLYSNYVAECSQTVRQGLGWIQRFPDLKAGTHEFRAIWGANGGTATMHVEHRPYMAVIEK